MKKNRYIFFIVPFLFILNGCLSAGKHTKLSGEPQQNTQAPEEFQIKTEDARDVWDFGRVKAGDIVKHSFAYKNETADTLNIQGFNVSCGCMSVNIDKMVLLSGETANIEASFNSQGYSGEVSQFVFVNTDSADNPVVRFTVKADVAP